MFKVHHIAISVSDTKKSVDFYSFFGFEKILNWKDENGNLEIVHLKSRDFILEIFSFKNYQKLPKNSQNLETDLPEIWVKHFFIKDPDGILLEIVEDKRGV